MPDGSLPTSVVRFTDTAGRTVGAGVLVGPREVLTCAHVVNLAAGRDKLDGEQPDEPVLVDFPGGATIRAHVRQWVPPPPREGAPGQDVTGVELAEEAPPDVTPAKRRGDTVATLSGHDDWLNSVGFSPAGPRRHR